MAIINKTTPESNQQIQTVAFKLDNLSKLNNVTVNTGNVEVVSVVGDTVTVKCINGASVRQIQTGGQYIPADSKTESGYNRVIGDPNAVTLPQSYTFETSDGYKGTLYLIGNPYWIYDDQGNGIGLEGWYSGTVYRPESDTRTYEYYYSYVLTFDYVINSAPTAPKITVPSIQFEHGDKHYISFDSTDAENDVLTYTLETSYNNGSSWSQIYSGTAKTYQYTVPSNQTQVKFRVKATDGKVVTAYTESSNKTIQEVMYFWNKFNNYYNPPTAYKGALFAKDVPMDERAPGDSPPPNRPSEVVGNLYYEYYWEERADGYYLHANLYEWITTPGGDMKGSLAEANIQASFNTYQHAQKNPDGFWYERGQRVLSEDITPPIIELTEQKNFGPTSTITVKTYDLSSITKLKWAKGQQSATYFASNGTNITNGSFTVSENGDYTVYAEDEKTNKAIQVFTVKMVNTAPTAPTLNVPTIQFEYGDKHQVTFSSTDAENNTIQYTLESSNDNGNEWQVIYSGQTKSFEYTVPSDKTQVKFRVKASDGILETGYTTSENKTIREVMYYWAKYNNVQEMQYTIKYNTPEVIVSDLSYQGQNYNTSGHPTYSYDPPYGFITPKGTGTIIGDYAGRYIPGTVYATPSDGYYYSDYLYIKSISYDSNYTKQTISTQILQRVPNGLQDKMGAYLSTVTGGYNAYKTGVKNQDGYWYVRGLRVIQFISPPGAFTSPSLGTKLKPNQSITIGFSASQATNLSVYEVDYKYNANSWVALPSNLNLTRSLITSSDKSLTSMQFRVRAKNTSNTYSDYIYSEVYVLDHNISPTITLTSPSNDVMLYKNDILTISGEVNDVDQEQNVLVYYQIDDYAHEFAIAGESSTQILLSKKLQLKTGKLYDGDIAVTEVLKSDKVHKLKVWAIDNVGGISDIIERTFTVFPNHDPLLTLNEIIPSGVLDSDKFTISGSVSDEDVDSVISVTYCINNGDSTEIYTGAGGNWEFNVFLSQLKVGENDIIINATDDYGAKYTKTVKLNKDEINVPVLESVARYKIDPPKGTAKGILLFIQRDSELETKVELSMTMKNEEEQFVEILAENTAPLPNKNGLVEDTYHHEVIEDKENIILKIAALRQDENSDYKIHLISGVVE
ncbi:gp426 [Bacillus phage G]|uniref:Gp426 n=1 Tax=Bacillus phage G TaxID=2884420 RepID=G3MAG7_9CAUD|nr:gp426 [Bacillus phage G]AEO93684.1 gp426 [Bacillus phage G]